MHPFGRKVLLIALLITLLGAWGFAQSDQGTGQDMKNAGNATKSAGQDVGTATKKTGKKAKRGVKKGVHKAAHKTRQGASKVENNTAPPQ
jgi:hypothetical protein